MFSVFLSYKRGTDNERAAVVREKIEALGVGVFQDIDMSAGSAVHAVLNAQLEAAEAVVVLWTKSSIDAQWVISEAQKGFDRGVLVAMVFDGVLPGRLHVPFNTVHTPDVSDWIESGARPDHRGWRSVLGALAGLLRRPLTQLAEAIEPGAWSAKAKYLQDHPSDPFAETFAAELREMRRNDFDRLIGETRDIIGRRLKDAQLKLDDIRSKFESELDNLIRPGRDLHAFDPRKLADSLLASTDDGGVAEVNWARIYGRDEVLASADKQGERRLPVNKAQARPENLVLKISFERRGLAPLVLALKPGPLIEAQLLGSRGAALGKGALATVEAPAKDPAVRGIRNHSKLPWRVMAGGRSRELAIGDTLWFAAGDTIDFGGGIKGVVETT